MIKILKDGSEVASFHGSPWAGEVQLRKVGIVDLWYFPKINLTPPVLFEHLGGASLSRWLDKSQLLWTLPSGGVGGRTQPKVMRYIHGRSEVMKGTPSISAVLLGGPRGDIDDLEWLLSLPAIYSEFMKKYEAYQKTA